jgi:hypothetical protein
MNMTQITRPKYFFPGKSAAQICDSAPPDPLGQTVAHVGTPSRIGAVGQASAALKGLIVDTDAYVLEQSATSPLGSGVLVEFIPNPIPDRYQTGMPKSGWKWHEFDAGNGETGFIGWPEGEPIGPENFERRTITDGLTVPDDLGNNWAVPVARSRTSEFGKLPTRWKMTKGGLETVIAKDSESIWQFGGDVLAYLRAVNAWQLDGITPAQEWADPWAFHATLRILGVNYHVGESEMILLEALDVGIASVDFVAAVLQSFTDFRAYYEYHVQKKTREAAPTTAATSNSVLGEMAESH